MSVQSIAYKTEPVSLQAHLGSMYAYPAQSHLTIIDIALQGEHKTGIAI